MGDHMNRFLAGLIAGLAVLLMATALAPAPPKSPVPFSQAYKSTTAQTATLEAQGTACSAVSGATCTIILPSTDVSGMWNVTVYVKNTGGTNALTNVLIEVSPDGVSWEEVNDNALDALAVGELRSANYMGHYAYIRVEGQSASGTTTSVWLSGLR